MTLSLKRLVHLVPLATAIFTLVMLRGGPMGLAQALLVLGGWLVGIAVLLLGQSFSLALGFSRPEGDLPTEHAQSRKLQRELEALQAALSVVESPGLAHSNDPQAGAALRKSIEHIQSAMAALTRGQGGTTQKAFIEEEILRRVGQDAQGDHHA